MNPEILETDTLLRALIDAARAAASHIRKESLGEKRVSFKSDGSPVTPTDAEAEALILEALRSITTTPIVAEEEFEAGLTPNIDPSQPFFLVDALDGTRDFIKGGHDFTVNIALVENRTPVMGVIASPMTDTLWYAKKGYGAYTLSTREATRLAMRSNPDAGFSLLGGKRSSEPAFLEPFLGPHTVADRNQRSSSLKFCLLAQGDADIYPRLGPTSEWDTAAGDIILRESGGALMDITTRAPVVYGKQQARFANNGFIAASRKTLGFTD